MNYRKSLPIFVLLFAALSLSFVLEQPKDQRSASDHMIAPLRNFPMVIGEWSGRALTVSERVYEILETRNVILREYQTPDGERVFLSLVLAVGDRRATHPPEVCYLGEDIEIVSHGRVNARLGEARDTMKVNKLLVQDGHEKRLVLYWYRAGSVSTASFWQQQIRLMLAKIKNEDAPAVLVRMSTPLGTGDEKTAQERIERFARSMIPYIESLS